MMVDLHAYSGSLTFVVSIAALLLLPMVLLVSAVDARRPWLAMVATAVIVPLAGFGIFRSAPSHAPLSSTGMFVTRVVSLADAHAAVKKDRGWTFVSYGSDDRSETYRDASGQLHTGCVTHFKRVDSHHAKLLDVSCTN